MDDVDPTRVAIAFGTGIGGIDELQKGSETLHGQGSQARSPLFVPTMIGNIVAGNLSPFAMAFTGVHQRGHCLCD